MKTAFYFIVTCFIATGAYLAGLNSNHIVFGLLSALAAWGLFLWRVLRR